jgi:GTP-binding protein
MPTRDDIRNVAIIAHVDHGKTTLVDGMLLQSGAYSQHQQDEGDVQDRVMDSMDLEREKGITILAKNTAVRRKDLLINIIDTPGHADFGGEVERGLSMVDGVALLVDASEGPLPQTRFVLRKALAQNMPVILIINKVDRPTRASPRSSTSATSCSSTSTPTESQIDFPIVYCQAKTGQASLTRPRTAPAPTAPTSSRCSRSSRTPSPPRRTTRTRPLQAHVTNLDASPYLGRLALCRIHNGWLKKGQTVAWCKQDGTVERVKLTELLGTEALERVSIDSAGPGDIVAIAGIPEITIGETLADPDDPQPLPLITIDEPNISMTIGINTSPLAGKSGKKLTARMVKDRLDKELVGNVSIRVNPTERPDTWEVQGRGELQLAILVEVMRRESFELTVGKPQVVTRTIDGKLHEPVERLTIDAPSDYQGVIMQLMALRKGRWSRWSTTAPAGSGWSTSSRPAA